MKLILILMGFIAGLAFMRFWMRYRSFNIEKIVRVDVDEVNCRTCYWDVPVERRPTPCSYCLDKGILTKHKKK